MTDVKVVAPMNMGKGITYDPNTKQYNVSLGSGLYFDENGVIQMKSNDPQVKAFDNGTGKIVHKQVVVDTGVTLEISGTALLPLAPVKFAGMMSSDPVFEAERVRLEKIYKNCFISWVVQADGKALGMNNPGNNTPIFQTETVMYLYLADLGISEVISATATAGDVGDYRKETAWIVNNITDATDKIPVGIHVYYSADQEMCAVSYNIKGIKA
ncbi:hypothetical protein BMT54_01745 [Pasteurellaceae bacterium 15-036681]|nr:hypothetical protein BMT54_01745 [Pasteurellaceae bacterium 15-036681]